MKMDKSDLSNQISRFEVRNFGHSLLLVLFGEGVEIKHRLVQNIVFAIRQEERNTRTEFEQDHTEGPDVEGILRNDEFVRQLLPVNDLLGLQIDFISLDADILPFFKVSISVLFPHS